MVEVEADDALGAAALVAEADGRRVDQVIICTPGQGPRPVRAATEGGAVRSTRRGDPRRRGGAARSSASNRSRSRTTWHWSATPPTVSRASPGWGAKSAATVLAHYATSRPSPTHPASGRYRVRGAAKLAATLHQEFEGRCCSGASPRSRPTSTSARWPSGGGTDRPPSSSAVRERLDAPDVLRRASAARGPSR